MKILITGIYGFVGSNLTKALSRDNEIYGLDIVSPEKEGVIKTFLWEELGEGVQEFNGSRVQEGHRGEIPEVDAIIHLAGKAHETKNKSKAEEYFKVNTELTQKIFDYFLVSKAKKFIFFSSVKAAADRVEGEFLDENVEPKPVGPYGESKLKAEQYILSKVQGAESSCAPIGAQASKLGAKVQKEKQVFILRPCMIHGPGNKGNLNLLYSVVSMGIPWPLGAFENKRTFTSIDNVSFIINGLLTKDVESGVYNINDDEAVSTNELIRIICATQGKQAHIWNLPRGLMTLCAKVGTLLHLPLNDERLQKLTESYVSSNKKIKRALDIDKLPVRAENGIKLTVQSFKTL